MSAWWSPNLTGVAAGAATGVKSPYGEFVQRDPNRAIGYQNQGTEGQFAGNYAPPTTGYTTAKYKNVAYDPSRDQIGAGADVTRWTNDLINEYRKRGINLDYNAVYADQWARKKRDLLAWGNAGDLARAGVDMTAIDANAHDIGNPGWEQRFAAAGYTGGQRPTPAPGASQPSAADTRSKALDDPYRIGAFTGGYYDPGTVSLLLDRATGKGTATPEERMQAAQTLKVVGLMAADNTPGDVAKWASERKLQAWADGQAPPGATGTASAAPPGTAGGQAMSAPMGSGMVQGATAASTAASAPPYVPPGTPPATPGTWTGPQSLAYIARPDLVLQQYLRGKGLDPAQLSRTTFGKYMMKNFTGLWDAYLASQGVGGPNDPNGVGANLAGGLQGIANQFGTAYTGSAGDFTNMINTATLNAMKNANLDVMDEKTAGAWLAKLMGAQQSFMNPVAAEMQKNMFDALQMNRDYNEVNAPNGMAATGSGFGTFLNTQPYWQQILASVGR